MPMQQCQETSSKPINKMEQHKRTPDSKKSVAHHQAAQAKAIIKSARLALRNEIIALRIDQLQEHFKAMKTYSINRWISNVTEREEVHTQLYGISNDDTNHCTICQEAMQHQFKLPCSGNHRFCQKCIVAWLEKSNEGHRCPLCRDDVSAWYKEKRDSLCQKAIKHYRQNVKEIVKEVNEKVGMKKGFLRGGVKDEEIDEVLRMYEEVRSVEQGDE